MFAWKIKNCLSNRSLSSLENQNEKNPLYSRIVYTHTYTYHFSSVDEREFFLIFSNRENDVIDYEEGITEALILQQKLKKKKFYRVHIWHWDWSS